jgi:hypothetical protein
MVVLIPSTSFGVLNLWDTAQGLPNIDNRVGSVAPSVAALNRVAQLGATADWNQFGTINTLIKQGGYISTGYSGEAVAAARSWINDNRELFRLSAAGVADLELVSDGRMPYNEAHFVLFRQKFGTFTPTQDGQINVSIINGNVFHVWSSSAGDLGAPAAATLTPLQGWLAAAANVGRVVPLGDVLSVKTDTANNWKLIKIAGYPQVQQVRLTAIPTPTEGVLPAYEANVVYNLTHITEAYTIFVNANTGAIIHRTNRVNWLSAAAAPPPETEVFSGEYDGTAPTACGPRHSFVVPAGKVRITGIAAASITSNDITVDLYFDGPTPAEIDDVLLSHNDTGTSPEPFGPYEPLGGVPAGTYKVQVCPFDDASTAPFSYTGTFTTDDTPVGGGNGEPYPPKWKFFRANPDLNYSDTDIARTSCWEAAPLGVPVPGCEFSLVNLASRAPWDFDVNAGGPTFTTRGNNAQTAESWGSFLTPSTPYSPTSASREYIFPWLNEWRKFRGPTPQADAGYAGCNPNLAHPGDGITTHDADVDRAIVHLFATHNRFHDFGYFLGYTEQNSNMQVDNFGNTTNARQNDPEVGNVQAGAMSGRVTPSNPVATGRNNANQVTLQDGVPGITNQYLFQPAGGSFYAPCTDGDMDVGIVGHEYTHGISNRMIGGPDSSIGGHQGGSMGESWSDQVAGEYNNAFGYVPTNDENPTAVGIYATGNKQLAIRNYALNSNPLNYSNVGYDSNGPEVHSDGEIWNGTNWAIRQALIDKYNATYPATNQVRQTACAEGKFNPENCPGNRRWIQLMFDSFLLMSASPSMLNARDAMLAADVARFGGANQIEMRRVFGQRGMGFLAVSNGGGDTAPIPDFSSNLETNATATFSVLAQDEGNVAITTAKIYVGHYEARNRPIADTDPATTVSADPRTNINDDTAMFVPGTYDFVVQASGYGMHRFTRTFAAGETVTLTFSLPTNRASLTKGATVTTTATDAADQAAKNNLIDDTENTGAKLGSVAPSSNHSMTVDLEGTAPLNVTSVNVSALGGPNNGGGRFIAIRQFEILASTDGTNFTSVYMSPADAFPSQRPRPAAPQLGLRNFDIPDTMATHLRLRVVTTQCTGHPGYAGEQDDDPVAITNCTTVIPGPFIDPLSVPPTVTFPDPPGPRSRLTEFQVFTSAPSIPGPLQLECDVFPRGLIDGLIDSTDVGQVERFNLGFDQPYLAGEFQRADCADYATKGDGAVDSLDVGQAQRYQLGLDLPQTVGGPMVPGGPIAQEGDTSKKEESSKETDAVTAPREVRVVSQNTTGGQTITLVLETDAMGDESIYGFSLNYNPAILSYVPGSITIGSGATRQLGGSCGVSSNTTTAGQFGISVNCFNSNITAGNNRQLVTLQFTVAVAAPLGATPVTFGDTPTIRKVSSNPADGPIQARTTTFTDGAVNIGSNRIIRVVSGDTSRSATATVQLTTDATGHESIYGFSLNYNTAVLTYVPGSITIGSGATRQSGGMCSVLSNSGTPGQLGFSINCNSDTITAGNNRQLVTMQFTVASNAPVGQTPLTFGDSPSARSVSTNPATGPIQALPVSYVDGFLNVLPPTSATVTVSGRVLSAEGNAVNGAIVSLTNGSGATRISRTNPFGYYSIEEVEVGETYTITVSRKGLQFSPRVVTILEEIEDLNFTAEPARNSASKKTR